MRWGQDFLRIWGGNIQTFGANGEKPNVKGRTHQTINYLSCLIHPIIYYYQKLVGLVIAWDGKGMTTQIRIGEGISFWKMHFDSLDERKPKNVGHSTMLSRWHVFLTHFSFTWALSGIQNLLCVKSFTFLVFPMILELLEFTIHVLCCVLHFSQGWEVVLLTISG